MGFYHPATLVKDAQRHGVRVLPIDIVESQYKCTLKRRENGKIGTVLRQRTLRRIGRPIIAARNQKPLRNADDLGQNLHLSSKEWATLAELGAFAPLGLSRDKRFGQA